MILDSRASNSSSPARVWPRFELSKVVFLGIGASFVTVLVIFPLASLVQYVSSNGVGVLWQSISSPEAVFSLKFTALLAIATTLINAVIGTVVAFTIVRHDFPLRGALGSFMDLPIAIPAAITGLTLLLLYGPLGIAGTLSHGKGLAFSGILAVHVFMTLPYVVRAVSPALQEMDIGQEEAAKTMGASELQVFLNVILPSIKAGLIYGSAFTFARSLGEFGATIMISGTLALRTQTAPMFIFSDFNRGGIEAASSMSVVLVIISLALFVTLKLVVRAAGEGGAVSAKRDIS